MAGFQLGVADHQGGPVEPGQFAKRCEVGRQMDVAVSELPVGEVVAGDRLHLHIDGIEVVAGVGAARNVGKEKGGVEALAHELAVGIRRGQDDGVYGAVVDCGAQVIEGEYS